MTPANALARAIAAAALALPFVPAAAQSLRCKGDFTQIGDSKASVLQKCGEPALKDSFCKPVPPTPPGGTPATMVLPCETVDQWTYNPGYGQFLTTLRFEAGVLTAVTYGDRVR